MIAITNINIPSPLGEKVPKGRMRVPSKGFTLIEVLIALSVFAILASITSSAMYQAFNTREHVTVQANRLNSLQLAVAIINRDIQQIVERSVLGNELHHFPPFTGQRYYIEFTRGGIINPTGMNRRGALQRIAYLCKKNRLYRRSWNVLDGPNRNQYQDKLILDNLSQCQFSFLAHNLQTLPRWQEYALQQNQRKETLPTSIQLAVNLNDWGKMSLSFIIPEALYAE